MKVIKNYKCFCEKDDSDIGGVYNPKTGKVTPEARRLLEQLSNYDPTDYKSMFNYAKLNHRNIVPIILDTVSDDFMLAKAVNFTSGAQFENEKIIDVSMIKNVQFAVCMTYMLHACRKGLAGEYTFPELKKFSVIDN